MESQLPSFVFPGDLIQIQENGFIPSTLSHPFSGAFKVDTELLSVKDKGLVLSSRVSG